MLRVRFEEREMLIRESLDLGRECLIFLPEGLRGGMPHGELERPDRAAPRRPKLVGWRGRGGLPRDRTES